MEPDRGTGEEHPPVAPPVGSHPDLAAGPVCTCGHLKPAHEHYRRGSDCALCACPRFTRGWWARLRFGRS